MNRRGFLQAILAAGVAPYVSTASGVLMPVRQRVMWLWGDGVHDDTAALQAFFDGKLVKSVGPAIAGTCEGGIFLSGGRFLTTATIVLDGKAVITNNYFTGMKDKAVFEAKRPTVMEISNLVFEVSHL